MKIKISEATGKVLDYLVAKALGYKFGHWQINNASYINVWAELVDAAGCGPAGYFPEDDRFRFSTDWAQGGPIIEREKVDLYYSTKTGLWAAAIWQDTPGGGQLEAKVKQNPTPLVAAMRCFVTRKLGDEVDVPEELLQ